MVISFVCLLSYIGSTAYFGAEHAAKKSVALNTTTFLNIIFPCYNVALLFYLSATVSHTILSIVMITKTLFIGY
ncbi:hypothetical protein FM109_02940 [Vibrio casei]|nr:hypothetical protein FM109_02940 [Vibrio casei]